MTSVKSAQDIRAGIEADLAEITRLTTRIRDRLAALPAPEPAPQEEAHGLLTRAEAARRMRVSEGTLKNLYRAGDLQVVRIGRRVLVPADAVDEYLTSRRAA